MTRASNSSSGTFIGLLLIFCSRFSCLLIHRTCGFIVSYIVLPVKVRHSLIPRCVHPDQLPQQKTLRFTCPLAALPRYTAPHLDRHRFHCLYNGYSVYEDRFYRSIHNFGFSVKLRWHDNSNRYSIYDSAAQDRNQVIPNNNIRLFTLNSTYIWMSQKSRIYFSET